MKMFMWRSCSPCCTAATVISDHSVFNLVVLLLVFLCFSLEMNLLDVGVNGVCLVPWEADAGVVKVILLFCWLFLCCSWRGVKPWTHVQLMGQSQIFIAHNHCTVKYLLHQVLRVSGNNPEGSRQQDKYSQKCLFPFAPEYWKSSSLTCAVLSGLSPCLHCCVRGIFLLDRRIRNLNASANTVREQMH